MTHSEELAWLAGLVEGEGCFSWSRKNQGGRRYQRPQFSLTMCDLDVVCRAMAVLNVGNISGPHRCGVHARQPQWTWSCYFDEAYIVMDALQPFMGERRSARIQELIDGPWGLINEMEAA